MKNICPSLYTHIQCAPVHTLSGAYDLGYPKISLGPSSLQRNLPQSIIKSSSFEAHKFNMYNLFGWMQTRCNRWTIVGVFVGPLEWTLGGPHLAHLAHVYICVCVPLPSAHKDKQSCLLRCMGPTFVFGSHLNRLYIVGLIVQLILNYESL